MNPMLSALSSCHNCCLKKSLSSLFSLPMYITCTNLSFLDKATTTWKKEFISLNSLIFSIPPSVYLYPFFFYLYLFPPSYFIIHLTQQWTCLSCLSPVLLFSITVVSSHTLFYHLSPVICQILPFAIHIYHCLIALTLGCQVCGSFCLCFCFLLSSFTPLPPEIQLQLTSRLLTVWSL